MKHSFEFHDCTIPGLVIIQPFYDDDARGCFVKSFEKEIFAEHGIRFSPWEELYSVSQKGTLRGLHFQSENWQDKLVCALSGTVYDVAVDLRIDSPTFGRWQSVILSQENRKIFYIPKGFAHGFMALEENTTVHYLCGDRYDPDSEGGILWNDSELNIDWPLDQVEQIILNERDQRFPTLDEFRNAVRGLKK